MPRHLGLGYQAGDRHWASRAELYAVGIAILFAMTFVLVTLALSGGESFARIFGLHWFTLVGLLGLSLVNYALRTLRWHLFARAIGVHVPMLRGGLYFASGFALTATPGKVGETLRLWLLRRGHGYSYTRTSSLLIADRLSDVTSVLLLSLAGVTAFTSVSGVMVTIPLGAAIAALAYLSLRGGWLLPVVGAAYALVLRQPRLFARVRTALRHARILASWRLYGGTLLLALAGWFAEAAAFFWLLQGLGTSVTLAQAVFVFAFAMLVGAMVMLPGGLVGTEATMVLLLRQIGVELEIAIAATAVIRVTTLWFAVALGFLALPLAIRSVRHSVPAAAVG